jgi:hypothetical protein
MLEWAWLTEGWQAALWLIVGLLVGRVWQVAVWRDPPRVNPWQERSCRDWDLERLAR